MTREEILAMKPGKELDRLVAIHVMGWSIYHYDKDVPERCYYMLVDDELDAVAHDNPFTMRNGERKTEEEAWEDNRPRSTDISAAWGVVEVMRNKLFSKRMKFLKELQNMTAQNGSMVAWPDVFWRINPETICKAALLVEMDESHG